MLFRLTQKIADLLNLYRSCNIPKTGRAMAMPHGEEVPLVEDIVDGALHRNKTSFFQKTVKNA